MQWTYASRRSNYFSVTLLASSLWISLVWRRLSISLISEFLCTVLPSRILVVRRCGWPYVASLHVHLTLRTKRCSESVVVSLLHLLLPCFSQNRLTRTLTQIQPLQPWLEASLVGLASRRLAKRKRPTFRQTFFFQSISGFLSSQAVSSQVLSAFMSLTTVFEMGTGGSSQPSPLNLSEFVL